MYAFLTPELVQLALDSIVGEAVRAAHRNGITNKIAGCFVVLDPETGEVMREYEIDPRHPKAKLYRQIAHQKAALSYRTKLPSRVVQNEEPWLLHDNDTRYGGSAVRGIGPLKLVVAFSGVESEYDEMFSGMGADAIIARCRNQRMARDKNPDGSFNADGDFVALGLGTVGNWEE